MLHRKTGSKATKQLEQAASELPNDTIEFHSSQEPLPEVAQTAPGRQPPTQGFRLDDGAIRLEHGEDLFGHTAFTLLIDFCREQEEDEGHLVSFDGSFSLAVEGGVLVGTVSTNRGSRVVRGALPAELGQWHRAALVFCGRSGRAELYLDGRRLSGVSDLAGAEQAGNFFADLCIGHRHGQNFPGLLDNFRFLDQPLGREDLPPLSDANRQDGTEEG